MSELEIWKPIPKVEGRYEASNLGRIRSLTIAGGKTRKRPHVLNPRYDKRGYRRVSLSVHGSLIPWQVFVHRVVLLAFQGPGPDGFHAAHLNGIKDDNRLINLKWTSVKENHSHKKLHGTMAVGERNAASRLTNDEVLAIRANYIGKDKNQKSNASELAKQFNTTATNISKIVNNKSWRHLIEKY